MDQVPRELPLGPGRGWRRRALARSSWARSRPGLPEFASEIFTSNLLLRESARTRSRRLLTGRPPVGRLVQVGFEVMAQTLALALDLRDASRDTGTPISSWIKARGGGHRLPERVLARIEASGELELPREETTPWAAATARRFRICLETLGPTFVKFGQLLGSAHGLLSDDVVAEFARCHDDVRPSPAADLIEVVEAELGPLASHFSAFDPRPIASASIAQVHGATLRSGEEVAVKIQRPGVAERMEADVAILHRIARSTESVDLLETLNLVAMTELFGETVVEELDFRLEAENMIELALAFEDAGHDRVCVPRPVPGLVTRRVLVMERLHGERLREAGDSGDAAALLRVGMQAVLEAALTYGVFHGDMHAGNMLALEDGRHGLLDFGIVGRFDEAQRWALTRWLASLASEDLGQQIASLGDLGAFPPGTDLDAITEQVEIVLEKIAIEDPERLGDIAGDFELIARILAAHDLRLPTELGLFLKNLLHVTGQARDLAPGADPLEVSGVLSFGSRSA